MEDEAIRLAVHCGWRRLGCMKGECGEAESGCKQECLGGLHEESVRAGTFGVPANPLPAILLRQASGGVEWAGFAQFNCVQV